MSQLPERLFDLLGPGDNLLLLSPPFVTASPEACVDLLAPGESGQENVLAVTYTKSPGDFLARWKQHGSASPAEATIINVETETRSAAPMTADGSPVEQRATVSVEHVSSPADLTDLGVTLTNQLDEWHAETPARQTVACVHSVTSLLQYVDLEQTFKFLDVVTGKFTEVDAIAHFHMDPTAHDDQTIHQLLPLFDVVCEYEDDEWSLQTAY